jgi:mannose-6-phosphate isomerase-like protein (cupin superfamily)
VRHLQARCRNPRSLAKGMAMAEEEWETKRLPERYDAIAEDGSEIRQLFATSHASVVHCTLPAGRTSFTTMNVGTEEMWYFLSGRGELWRAGKEEPTPVEPNVAVTIPADVQFQFRSLSDEPLTFLCVTMPKWREGASVRVVDHWPVV